MKFKNIFSFVRKWIMPFVVGLAFVVPACSDAGNEPVKNNQNLGLNYDNNWRAVNNLEGDYIIEFCTSINQDTGEHTWKKLAAFKGRYRERATSYSLVFTDDSYSPAVVGIPETNPYDDCEEIAPNFRFSFFPIFYEGQDAIYMVSSPYDPYGKLYVNSYDSEYGMVRLKGLDIDNAINNKSSLFRVEENDSGYCRFIVFDGSGNGYFLSMNRKFNSLYVASSFNSDCVFKITPVIKNTQPLRTWMRVQLTTENTMTRTERTLVGLSSDYAEYNILGYQYSLGYGFTTNDDENSTFKQLPNYDSFNQTVRVLPGYNLTFSFYSTYNPLLKNSNRTWSDSLGYALDTKGNYRDWCVYDDDRIIVDYNGSSHTVGSGLAVLNVGKSLKNMTAYDCFPLFPGSSELLYDRLTVDSSLLLNGGSYFSIDYLYTIGCQRKDGSHQKLMVKESSVTIFASYSGLEEGTFSPITVYTDGNNYSSSSEGVSINCHANSVYNGKALLEPNSLTFNNVYVDKKHFINNEQNSYSANYQVFVRESNTTDWTEIDDSWSSTDGVYGKIDIKLKNKYGDELIQSVYHLDQQTLLDNFVGTPFSLHSSDSTFIRGDRILGGKSTTLEEMGIHLPYSTYSMPLYSKKARIKFGGYEDLWFSFAIYHSKEYDREEYDMEYFCDTQGPLDITLTKEGFYKISLIPNFNKNNGYQIEYTFEFYIINDEPEPFLNRELIYNASNNVYDLNPRYYLVKKEEGSVEFVVYKDDGSTETIYKQKQLFFAFANYEEALAFALRIEKAYVQHVEGSDEYTYTKASQDPMDEYALFGAMYENAKKNVQVSYFALSNPNSIQGIYYSDEQIQKFIKEVDSSEDDQYIYLIVTENSMTLQELLVKQPIINDHKFLNVMDGNDSSEIKMICLADNTEYSFEADDYNIRVADVLKEKEAPSGRYIVRESNNFKKSIEYEVTYIEEGGDPSATLSFKGVTENDNGVYQGKSFSFDSFKGIYDEAPFIIVSYTEDGKEKKDVYTLSNYENAKYSNPNIYSVKLCDRVGNEKTYTVEITSNE